MTSIRTLNERAAKEEFKKKYQVFLEERGEQVTPDNAYLFCVQEIRQKDAYLKLNEREAILFLAGELPYMY